MYDAASGTFGYEFHGNDDIQALGDGFYYVAESNSVEDDGISKNDGDVYLYRWTGDAPTPFERVTTR